MLSNLVAERKKVEILIWKEVEDSRWYPKKIQIPEAVGIIAPLLSFREGEANEAIVLVGGCGTLPGSKFRDPKLGPRYDVGTLIQGEILKCKRLWPERGLWIVR